VVAPYPRELRHRSTEERMVPMKIRVALGCLALGIAAAFVGGTPWW
jgi:hypothetical protein